MTEKEKLKAEFIKTHDVERSNRLDDYNYINWLEDKILSSHPNTVSGEDNKQWQTFLRFVDYWLNKEEPNKNRAEIIREYRPLFCSSLLPKEAPSKERLMILIEKIQDKVDAIGFNGQNEYDLHVREYLSDALLSEFTPKEGVSDAVEFAIWYSGMDKQKVVKAYERYKNEIL